jgi:tRNA pseudouridine38-40 synthase
MFTYKIVLQYDGTRYAGWQRQGRRGARGPVLRTVQGETEKALETALRRKVVLEGSGRTDAGVHAVAQVAHFAAQRPLDVRRIKGALNGILPADIRVSDILPAPRAFHARYQTSAKTYVYVLAVGSRKSAFRLPWVTEVPYDLDLRAMRRAARAFIGRKDFKSFQGRDRVARGSVTRVDAVRVRRVPQQTLLPFLSGRSFVILEVTAAGFLRSMVRNIAGTLIEVGRGALPARAVAGILRARDRRQAGPCAPAKGLFLKEVLYPASKGLVKEKRPSRRKDRHE